MGVTLVGVCLFLVSIAAVVAAAGILVAQLFGWPRLPVIAAVSLVPMTAAVSELRARTAVPNDATPLSADHQLRATVARLAQTVDLPAPTVLVTETDTPLAYVVGYTPGSTRLVLSTGLVELLEPPQLRAVVAHELAHVVNRDAALTTATFLPIAVASRLLAWGTTSTETVENGRITNAGGGSINPLFVLAIPLWALSATAGRLLAALLGKSRQFAADRGAVAIVGSAGALATAIRRIDAELDDRPPTGPLQSERQSLSVVAKAVADPDRIRLGPDGKRVARRVHRSRQFGAWLRRTLSTHPPVGDRIDRLHAMERELESDRRGERETATER